MGGSFDPIHYGHLAAAEAALKRLAPAVVLFMPAAVSPDKTRGPRAPAAERLRMIELAAAERPYFRVSGLELRRGGSSFTAETLRLLRALLPAPELWLAAGSDIIAGLPAWKEAETIRRLARLVCVSRPGYPPVSPPGWEIVHIAAGTPDISSSLIRARVRAGASLTGLTPAAVEKHITDKGLYRR
ncbi:MAG: nicotinate (nicotinamide) nucleotide adenylyltransferase [Gracilibacteraceae bacterium]|nr:nicotinate (nicotinamide) nucleotide adenylyltransferase [Gracilibacteraceae bacterium]